MASRVWTLHGEFALGKQRQPKMSIKELAGLLRECSESKTLSKGKLLHAQIDATPYRHNTFLANLLIHMYGRCGELGPARSVFDSLREPNLFSWTIMLATYAQNGHLLQALRLYREMHCSGVKPDRVTMVNVLGACTSLGDLQQGKYVHEQVILRGLERDGYVANSLVSMYGRCGRPEESWAVFERASNREDVVAWNSMLRAFAENDWCVEAVELYERMEEAGVRANEITLTTVLEVCSKTGNLEVGKRVHAKVESGECELDTIVANSLVNMYGRCGSLNEARKVFEAIRCRRVVTTGVSARNKDIVHWNAMISAFIHNGSEAQAIGLYREMLSDGVFPDLITLVSVIGACSGSSSFVRDGITFHSQVVVSGFSQQTSACNALINMYGKFNRTEDAAWVFETSKTRNTVTWNAMISAYIQRKDGLLDALVLFRKMDLEGVKPDAVTFINVVRAFSSACRADHEFLHARIRSCGFNSDVVLGTALINMYGASGDLESANRVLHELREKANVVSWTALITANAENGRYKEALRLYTSSEYSHLKPDRVTYIAVVDACSATGDIQQGRAVHQRISASGYDSDSTLGNALVFMYGKCGCLGEAVSAFDKISTKTTSSWNSLIKAHAENGCFTQAIALSETMTLEGVTLDEITVVEILFSCSHAGVVDKGLQCFVSMSSDYGLAEATFEHYVGMVDLFGRAGKLAKAEELLEHMPFEPDYVAWMTLLCSYKLHSNVESGKRIAEHVFRMNPEVGAPFVTLSNIFVER